MAKQKIELLSDFTIGYFKRTFARKKFKTLAAVGESVELSSGTYHLSAGNGSGKTTLLKTLAGIIVPGKGEFKVTGSLQCLFDNLAWDNELTGHDIIESFRSGLDIGVARKLADDLEADLTQPYAVLSRGQRQKINIILVEGAAAAREDAVCLYDEPLSGMDISAVEKLADYWKATDNCTLRVFSEHMKPAAFAIHGVLEIKNQMIVLRREK